MPLARTKPGSIIESLAPRGDHIDRDIAEQIAKAALAKDILVSNYCSSTDIAIATYLQ
jgi:hypothetical protein